MGLDSAVSQRLHEAVERRDAECIAFLQELVRIPSVTGQEALIGTVVGAAFEDAGLQVRTQEVDAARVARYLAGARSADFSDQLNVIGAWGGTGGGRSLLLNGHMDTVAAGDSEAWAHPPFAAECIDGELWGRGACDMKGGLVACLYAVHAVRDAGLELCGDVVLAATVAEETGGAGSIAFALDGPKTDAAIVAEPTGLAIAPAHTGAAALRITLQGQSAHACVRDLGVSAIEKFVALFDFLQSYEKRRKGAVKHPLFAEVENPVPLNVGVVSGGESPTIVPDSATADVRIGIAPGEDFDSVRREFEAEIHGWAAGDEWLCRRPPRLEWTGVSFPPSEVPPEHELVGAARAGFDALARPAQVRGMTYGTDMTHFVRIQGTPTILFGPGDMALAHGIDERIPVDEVHDATRVLAGTLVAWCGLAEAGR